MISHFFTVPYLASAAILNNYPGRKPLTYPGGVSRSPIEPLAPRGAAPAAPSTLAAKDHGRPTKWKALLWAG